MTYQHLLLDVTDGVATLSINRPTSLNALSLDAAVEMIDVLDRLRDKREARALVLTGVGRGFCSGADLAQDDIAPSADIDAGKVLENFYPPLAERLLDLPIPIVAAVNGVAAGAGCSLALLCDIVVAARSAYFLQAFVNIGLVPDMGATWLLPRVAGRGRAQAMMMLGEKVSAEEAEAWGMIYKAVDDDALASTAAALGARLATGPTVAYGLIRKGVREALDQSFSESLGSERRRQMTAGRTRDFAEGVAAFREKRRPVFEGR
jgi:2-(1,2-epoxy-1,2-dihydrophenyl)acetyl-CoA isomerase